GDWLLRAEHGEQAIVAAAADQRAPVARGDLEDEAGVVVERAAEGGVVDDQPLRQLMRGDRRRAGAEQLHRRAQRHAGVLREGFERVGRLLQRRADGEEGLQRVERFLRQAHAAQLLLFGETLGDFLRRAAGGGGQTRFLHARSYVAHQPVVVAHGDQFRRLLVGGRRVRRVRKVFERARKLRRRAEGTR